KTADPYVVADLAVTAERGRVGESHVAADPAVVTDMAVRHPVTPIPGTRDPSAADGAGVDGHRFPQGAVFANDQPRRFVAIAQRLRRRTNRRERIDHRAGAD